MDTPSLKESKAHQSAIATNNISIGVDQSHSSLRKLAGSNGSNGHKKSFYNSMVAASIIPKEAQTPKVMHANNS